MMPKLYIMVGLPGSGKSTYAINHPDCVVISTDLIRQELLGSCEDQSRGDFIFKTAFERITKALREGNDVIFDATNVSKKHRKRLFQFRAKPIAVYMNVSIEECKRRNALRERKVPDDVIDRMASRLMAPTLEEGFKEIIVME